MDYFDILLARKLANGGDITTESLSVTENGTYTAPSGKAYSPVTVEVEPPEDSYQLKTITTPTSLATFEASEMPMPSLKVSVEAKQEGSGVPSPENVRPISGWSEVVVSDVDDVDNPTVTQTTTISLGQTVYGGEVDVVNGESTTQKKKVVFDGSVDEPWYFSVNAGERSQNVAYILFSDIANAQTPITNIFEGLSNRPYSSLNNWQCASSSTSGAEKYINFVVDKTLITSISDWRTWLSNNNLEIVYELETPTTFTTQPTPIKSLNGINNLSVDCGEIIEGEYFIAL